jgi:simple sugar transport system substrate-binding protein
MKLFAVLLVLVMLAACGGQQPAAEEPAAEEPAAEEPSAEEPAAEENEGEEAEAEADDPFRVGLLVSGPANDEGWNQQAYDALLRTEEELGAEISYVELEENPAAFEKAYRDYASEGYDIILGHGFQFEDAALTVAEEFPDIWFFVSSSTIAEGNVIGVDVDDAQPFYLLGVIAGSMGNGAGLVGGVEIPPISESFTGFINGARSVNPDFPVSVTYLGNWNDIAAAKEAALGQIAEGADFLAPNANIAGQGVYQAVQETDEEAWAFGTFGDQTELAPEKIVANFVSDFGAGLVGVFAEVQDGTFEGGENIVFGVDYPEVVHITYNDGADLEVPDEVRQQVEAAIEGMISGEIDAGAALE